MRALCFADVHLGAGAEYGPVAFGPGSRLADQESILGQLASRVDRESPDVVLFAGDAFHRRRPSPAENEMWRRFIVHVSQQVPIVMIPGNHDVTAFDRPTALTPFASGLPNVHLADKATSIHVLPDVYVLCVPWVPMSYFASQRPDTPKHELHHEAATAITHFIRAGADVIRHRQPAAEIILLTHWSISGAETPTGADVSGFSEVILPARELETSGVSAVVAGHIHAYQQLEDENDPVIPMFYCGSPNVVDFGEANMSHGYVVLDTDPLVAEFQSLLDRRFVTIDFDGDDFGDVRGAVVRVRVKLPAGEHVDQALIRQELLAAGAHKVYAIQVEHERDERVPTNGHVDETTAIDAVFDSYLAALDLSDDRSAPVRAKHTTYTEALG